MSCRQSMYLFLTSLDLPLLVYKWVRCSNPFESSGKLRCQLTIFGKNVKITFIYVKIAVKIEFLGMLAIVIILAILFLSESKFVKNTFFRCQRSSGAFLSAKRSQGIINCILPWII